MSLGIHHDLETLKNLPYDQQKKLFDEIVAERKKAKVVNYSATYKVGKTKLARSTGMSLGDAEQLLDGFWDMNWSLKTVAEEQQVRKIGGQMWLKNPVSGFWYSLRYEKDIFSTLNQGTGVFCFDSWLAQCWVRGVKGAMQFHDEVVVAVEEGQEEENTRKMREAISAVNDKLKLNVPLDIDIKYGPHYASVH